MSCRTQPGAAVAAGPSVEDHCASKFTSRLVFSVRAALPSSAAFASVEKTNKVFHVEHFSTIPAHVPERQLNPVPQPELVVDDAEMILHHVFSCADDFGHFVVLEASRDQFDHFPLARAGCARPIETACGQCRDCF